MIIQSYGENKLAKDIMSVVTNIYWVLFICWVVLETLVLQLETGGEFNPRFTQLQRSDSSNGLKVLITQADFSLENQPAHC